MATSAPPVQPVVKPELKFVADTTCTEFARGWLRHHCRPDPTYREGIIRSVYYDTPQLDAFNEKVNGDFYKQKVRLRWYDPDTGADPSKRNAFLEVKHKVGGGRQKERIRLVLESEWLENAPLSDARFMNVLRTAAPGLIEATAPALFPSLVVQYHRIRYICPISQARVCLDTGIQPGRVNSRLLAAQGCATIRDVVIEVKDAEAAQIPWLESVYAAGFRQRSFSKYGECVARVTAEEY